MSTSIEKKSTNTRKSPTKKKTTKKKTSKKSPSTTKNGKHPGGRPSNYRSEMCDLLLGIMSKGESIVCVAADFGVCTDKIYEWRDKHPEFQRAISRGMALAEAYWERMAKSALENRRTLNSGLWGMIMKNRFGWSDKLDSNQVTEKKVTLKLDLADVSDDGLSKLENMEPAALGRKLKVVNG